MQPLPHAYTVAADGSPAGTIAVTTTTLPSLTIAEPLEFDGPGTQWSPEALLMGAAASCYILTFRAIARASKLDWKRLECTVEGTLERVNGVTRFSRMVTRAELTVAGSISEELCQRVLAKTERGCLIANSLRAQRELRTEIVRAPPRAR